MKDQSLKELEDEVREELGITNVGPNMSTHEAGMLGGFMVKKLIERAEREQKEKGGEGM